MAFGYVRQFFILRRCMLKYLVSKCHTCSLRSNDLEDVHRTKANVANSNW